MSFVEIISLIGVIISLVCLSLFVLKGVNNYLMAFAATIIITLTSRLELYNTLVDTYMGGFSGFIKSFYLIFFTGALFGKLMVDSGAAKTVAEGLVKLFGQKYSPLAIPFACLVLAYGGITTFVVGFCLVPIGVQIHRNTDTPRRFLPAAIFFGTSIAMVAPGSPQIANIICAKACEANYMGGGAVGFISVLAGLIIGCFTYMWMIKRAVANGEHFVAKETDIGKDEGSMSPNFILSLLPILITVISINITDSAGTVIFPTEYGIGLGCLSILVLNYRFFDRKEILPAIGECFKTSLIVIGNTSAIVGIGAVIKEAPMFDPLVAFLTSFGGNPYLSGAISIAVMAGVLGSASGSTSLVAPILAPVFITQGADPGMLARTMTIASASLDSLPHSGAVNSTIYAMCNETYESSYKPMFIMTVVVTSIMTLLSVVLGNIFY